MAAALSITTADELLAAGDIGPCELVRGALVMMSPAGFEHGRVTMRVSLLLGRFVAERDLGEATAAETGFLIARDPDTVRAPDVAFVRKERLRDAPIRGYFEGAPDLAVEVLSPEDRPDRTLAKIRTWLDAGTVEVWVIDPEDRTVAIHRSSDSSTVVLGDSESLRSKELLPGFVMPVAEVFLGRPRGRRRRSGG